MDLIDKLTELSLRIPKLREQIKTEEATKTSLVMPFIAALGYDVSNPSEVTPEFIADRGTKKGEKVDYAILQNNKPLMLFECKSIGSNLKKAQADQLFRYYTTTETPFGILTDGVIYRFYADLEKTNRMDEDPFFVFDLENITDSNQLEILKFFSKANFDRDSNIKKAFDLKDRNAIKIYFETVFVERPPDSFVRSCLENSKANGDRNITKQLVEKFTPIVRDELKRIITDRVIQMARDYSEPQKKITSENSELETEELQLESKTITTQEEIDAYFAVKSIVREVIDVGRLTMDDNQSYCNILVDGKSSRRLCRLYFNATKKKYFVINEEKLYIQSVNDMYKYADQLKAVASQWV